MGFSSLKMVAPPQFSGTNKHSIIKPPTELRSLRTHLQVRSEQVVEQQRNCKKRLTFSRRDTMVAGVSLASITLFPTDSAEARIFNPEIRRKIFEKLKMLREKAGLSKSESKDKKPADNKQKTASSEHKHESPSGKDKEKPTPPPPPPQPSPPRALSEEKVTEPAKQDTLPPPIPSNSQIGHLIGAITRK